MQLYIKDRVCHRCKMVVKAELEKLRLHPLTISLGAAIIEEKQLSNEQSGNLSAALQALGFELIDDKRSKLIEQIKTLIIDTIQAKQTKTNR